MGKTMLCITDSGSLVPQFDEERNKLVVRVENNNIISADTTVRGLSEFVTLTSGSVVVRLDREKGFAFGKAIRELRDNGGQTLVKYDYREKVFFAQREYFSLVNELLLQTFDPTTKERQYVVKDRRFIHAVDRRSIGTHTTGQDWREMQEELLMEMHDVDSNRPTPEEIQARECYKMLKARGKRRILKQRY